LLLADDSVTIQRVIELTFADEDIRVVAVGDGDQAIAAIDQAPPDIVLADVGMPGRDGYEVALHIRTTPRLAHIPVLLLTGAFEPVDQARAAQVQCDGVLAKPFEPQLVIGRVKELLARPRELTPTERIVAPPPISAPWPAILDEPAGGPSVAPAVPVAATDVDRYFDRLDQAFANLANSDKEPAKPAAASAADTTDWFSTTTAPASDAATTRGPREAASPLERSSSSADVRAASVAAPPAPPLADVFVALLTAEQAVPPPPPEQWPTLPPPPAEPAISDAAVQEIVRRVLEQLSDRVVRETVAGIVSEVAERLVREEIAEIKKNA
jgi:CheY-like chemotaxis protein